MAMERCAQFAVKLLNRNNMGHQTISTEVYGNISVLAPNGTLMFRCGKRKANWYLSRDLAKIVNENPLTVQLLFEPNGYGHATEEDRKDFFLSTKQAECVVCGATIELTKHHCVPDEFRKQLPDSYKNHNYYDILLLCVSCHKEYETEAAKVKNKIFKEIKQNFIDWEQIYNRCGATLSYVRTLTYRDIPLDRKQELYQRLSSMLYRQIDEDTNIEKLLQEVTQAWNDAHIKFQEARQNGIRDYVNSISLDEFVIKWRKHFVDTMKPKFLPHGWKVNAAVKRD